MISPESAMKRLLFHECPVCEEDGVAVDLEAHSYAEAGHYTIWRWGCPQCQTFAEELARGHGLLFGRCLQCWGSGGQYGNDPEQGISECRTCRAVGYYLKVADRPMALPIPENLLGFKVDPATVSPKMAEFHAEAGRIRGVIADHINDLIKRGLL